MAKRKCPVCGKRDRHVPLSQNKLEALREAFVAEDWLELHNFISDKFLPNIHEVIYKIAGRNEKVAEILSEEGEDVGDPDWCKEVWAVFMRHGDDKYSGWQLLACFAHKETAEKEAASRKGITKVIPFRRIT